MPGKRWSESEAQLQLLHHDFPTHAARGYLRTEIALAFHDCRKNRKRVYLTSRSPIHFRLAEDTSLHGCNSLWHQRRTVLA